jgi:hypothetical protein
VAVLSRPKRMILAGLGIGVGLEVVDGVAVGGAVEEGADEYVCWLVEKQEIMVVVVRTVVVKRVCVEGVNVVVVVTVDGFSVVVMVPAFSILV